MLDRGQTPPLDRRLLRESHAPITQKLIEIGERGDLSQALAEQAELVAVEAAFIPATRAPLAIPTANPMLRAAGHRHERRRPNASIKRPVAETSGSPHGNIIVRWVRALLVRIGSRGSNKSGRRDGAVVGVNKRKERVKP